MKNEKRCAMVLLMAVCFAFAVPISSVAATKIPESTQAIITVEAYSTVPSDLITIVANLTIHDS